MAAYSSDSTLPENCAILHTETLIGNNGTEIVFLFLSFPQRSKILNLKQYISKVTLDDNLDYDGSLSQFIFSKRKSDYSEFLAIIYKVISNLKFFSSSTETLSVSPR